MFARLKIYRVYLRKDDTNPLETARFIKEGFSIFAFLFGVIWAIAVRAWLLVLICAVVLGGLIALLSYGFLSEIEFDIVRMLFLFFLGCEAFDSLCSSLENKGYSFYDVVSGKNEQEAKQRFFDREFIVKTKKELQKI